MIFSGKKVTSSSYSLSELASIVTLITYINIPNLYATLLRSNQIVHYLISIGSLTFDESYIDSITTYGFINYWFKQRNILIFILVNSRCLH